MHAREASHAQARQHYNQCDLVRFRLEKRFNSRTFVRSVDVMPCTASRTCPHRRARVRAWRIFERDLRLADDRVWGLLEARGGRGAGLLRRAKPNGPYARCRALRAMSERRAHFGRRLHRRSLNAFVQIHGALPASGPRIAVCHADVG